MTFARIRALVFVGVLLLGAAVVVTLALTRDTRSNASQVTSCPSGSVPAAARLPNSSSDVKLNIYNGTKTPNLATRIGNELKNRGFKVLKVRTAPGNKTYNEVAVIRFGPKAVGNAWLMRSYFLDEATTQFDVKRTDDTVDLILGTQFRQLATSTEVNQSIAALGNPILPEGTCDAAAG